MKLENQDVALDEKLQFFKKMFFDFEQKLKAKVDSTLFNKYKADA